MVRAEINNCSKFKPNISKIYFTDQLLLLNFLKVYDFDLDRSKKLLLVFLTLRKKNPHLFTNRDLYDEKFRNANKVQQVFALKDHSPEGYKISIVRTFDIDLSGLVKFIKKNNLIFFDTLICLGYSSCDFFRFIIATLDARLVSDWGIPEGEVVIFDMKNFGFKHLMKFLSDPSNLKTYMTYSQETAPINLVHTHYINCSSVIPKLMTFLRPFMNKHLANSVRFHSSLDTLYEYLPKSSLPNEYGGNIGNLDDLNKNWMEVFMSKR